MKLALVISSLGGGGAERVMTALANAWAARGNEVTLVTLSSRKGDKYSLDPAVRRIALDMTGRPPNFIAGITNNFSRICALRRAIMACQPDVVISFIAKNNVLVLGAMLGLRVPVIVSERTFPNAYGVRGIWRLMYHLLYPRAAAVVLLTHRCATLMGGLARRAVVIPNPVLAEPMKLQTDRTEAVGLRASHCAGARRTLLAVGRLSQAKGFDLLIEAFARIAAARPDWNLTILGEGQLRASLTRSVENAGLASRISLPGFDPRVREAMRNADLFVLSSRFEGLPNALMEAMAEGKACVSFDCDTGPRELIEHGRNGWLVPAGDVEALADALDTLMRDAGLRSRLGGRAREVCTTYSLSAILDQWNALVTSTVSPSPHQTMRACQR